MDIVFQNGPEFVLLKILFKLNMVLEINQSFHQVCQNAVPLTYLNLESFFAHLKKLIGILNNTMQVYRLSFAIH